MAKMSKAITSGQIRAARALLKMSGEELAAASLIGIATVRRAELAEEEPSLTPANLAAIRAALEGAGVEFIEAEGRRGPGVRLRKRF